MRTWIERRGTRKVMVRKRGSGRKWWSVGRNRIYYLIPLIAQVQHPAISVTLLAHTRGIHLKRKSLSVTSRRAFYLFAMHAKDKALSSFRVSLLTTTTISAQTRGLPSAVTAAYMRSWYSLVVEIIETILRDIIEYR